ncbi:MAG TPA: hypothetical protein PK536_04440 [Ignavibacteria bacterium]|nr:hypothetical protein [Bacteroidota bacterium]HRI84677.1 hypothetical protein [Ignavibacteria bacterium]HRJ99696.1 hypothetical protein [Ignavibacteria bacterium]
MKKTLPVYNTNNGSGTSPEKFSRKKFFKFTGLAAAGMAAVSLIPFGIFRSKSTKPAAKINIEPNPHAVGRKSGKSNKV